MNIHVKTILKWLIVTNILVIVLPMIYMIQNTTVDLLLASLSLLGTIKLALTITIILFGVTERRKNPRPKQHINKWIR